ncbi:YwiC-like family protein [Litchfieldia alkalitelluris]|uniref:YwiC-like family protein n=1 Tax=Litchfieldia alkalitelluris TaxID=304268 RepID=UPI000996AD4E|nr:YwiC-like family protein [Litchfieldia alkalitelluris]
MKILLPKQHGAWAMLVIPFLLGIFLGSPTWLHIPLFIGWLFLYLATYPLLMVIKNKNRELHVKWTVIYLVPVVFSLVIVVISNVHFIFFGLIMLPFFLVNIYYAKRKNERALINDFSAIIAFSIGGLASYYAGVGVIDQIALMIFTLSSLFFIGSTFFVKTMIREKKNVTYKWISWGYHAGLVMLLIVVGYPLLVIGYLPSLIRAIYLYGKNLSIMKIGILEIINSVIFFLATLIFVS